MRLTPGAITRNWQLKLSAATLALFLWVVVSAEQVTSEWLPVNVQVVARNPEYALVSGPSPAAVEVRFAAPGREMLELALERPTLVLPLADVEDGREVFVLDPRMVRIPGGMSAVPLDVRPSSVRVRVQRVVTREVPVRLRLDPRSRERFVLTDSPVVRPARVRVSGPADLVEGLDVLETEPLELTGGDSAFVRTLELRSPDPRLELGVRSVRVSGSADRMVERLLPRTPLDAPEGLRTAPEQVDLRLRGPARTIREIRPAGVRAMPVADSIPDELPTTGAVVPVRILGLPEGVGARVTPGRVRVLPAGPPGPPERIPADTMEGQERGP